MELSSCQSKDEDYVEEELLIYAEFDSILDVEMFQGNPLFKVIALETDEPFMQIGNQVYSGKWLDSVGTHLFFEPEAAPPPVDPLFSDMPANVLNYKYKTRKYLEFSRVFINLKQNNENMEQHFGDETGETEVSTNLPEEKKLQPQPNPENRF